MSGIAGIAHSGKRREIDLMLEAIKHRGPAGKAVLDLDAEDVTLGIVWPGSQAELGKLLPEKKIVRDSAGAVLCSGKRLFDCPRPLGRQRRVCRSSQMADGYRPGRRKSPG